MIDNIRLGFATNSSSTHSIVIMPHAGEGTDEYTEFGWDYFTAANKESKSNYFALTLKSAIHQSMPLNLDYPLRHQLAREAVKAILGVEPPRDGYVDHQSMENNAFPVGTDKKLQVQFIRELFDKFTTDQQIVVLGGNDNDDTVHPLSDDAIGEFRLGYGGIAVKDPKGYWAIFNAQTGTKLRVNLASDLPITKASYPELVDVKITDYCTMNCAFCYQGSTERGKHASFSDICQIIDALAAKGTFEIAFGGGEPTQWEGNYYGAKGSFSEVLKYCSDHGIVGNFTTKNMGWLSTPEAEECLKRCGGMAFSISTIAQATQVLKIFEKKKLPKEKLSFQYVMGSNDLDLAKLFQFSSNNYVRVTLLGFKTINRGEGFAQTDYSNWLQKLVKHNKTHYGTLIGIDTALLQQTGQEALKAAGIDQICYTMDEGKFSCYIDAVAKSMYPSSYTLEPAIPLTIHPDNKYMTKPPLESQIAAGFGTF